MEEMESLNEQLLAMLLSMEDCLYKKTMAGDVEFWEAEQLQAALVDWQRSGLLLIAMMKNGSARRGSDTMHIDGRRMA